MSNWLNRISQAVMVCAVLVTASATVEAGVKGKTVDPFNYTLEDGTEINFVAVFNTDGTMVETRSDGAVFNWTYFELDLAFLSLFRTTRNYGPQNSLEERILAISLLNIIVIGNYDNDDDISGKVFGIVSGPARAGAGGAESSGSSTGE